MSRCYLLTGASGVIGSAIVPILLAEKATKLFILLRANDSSHLESRFQELCDYWGISQSDPIRARLAPIRGDVKLEQLGLSNDEYQQFCKQITNIIHAAGNVRMNLDIDDARSETVGVARHIIEVFQACKKYHNHIKLDYVSTIGVCGKLSGSIIESHLSHNAGFNNSYEQTKYESEDLLWQLIDAGEAVTIHRPSMVIGDSSSGVIKSFQVFYHLTEFLSGRHTCGFLPQCRTHLIDLIPVDYVARALCISSQQETSIGRVFHLCSGRSAPRLGDIINKVQARHPKRVHMVPVFVFILLTKMFSFFLSKRNRKKLATLPYFLSYLQSEQVFTNSQTCAYFEQHGLRPKHWNDYIDGVLQYYWLAQSVGE